MLTGMGAFDHQIGGVSAVAPRAVWWIIGAFDHQIGGVSAIHQRDQNFVKVHSTIKSGACPPQQTKPLDF